MAGHQRAVWCCEARPSWSKSTTSRFLFCGPPWIYGFICTANQTFSSAVFQMFETRSSRLWPRSDASKLGSDPPVFSWLSWMSESGEDSIAVWPGAADSSIWDPSINKEHRPVRRPANGPRRALSQQHLDTDGTRTHTHHTHEIQRNIYRYALLLCIYSCFI